ncbi:MAG TPA: hypothetical protein VHP64_00410, partial [Candidatus Limnocylindria bacterium]|nr:hypothetical protein [Candidatus Limnocylindria bacterium]
MTDDPNRFRDREATEPVEVQHYGPAAHREPYRASWQEPPGWSRRPASPSDGNRSRRGLGAFPVIAIAVVAGIVSGSLSAVAVSNLVDDPATRLGPPATEQPDANPVSEVRIDESSAVIEAI